MQRAILALGLLLTVPVLLAVLPAGCGGPGEGALLDAGPRGSILTEPLFEPVDVGLGTATAAANLFDIWGSGPEDIWIVGERSTILHFDGESWVFTNLSATTTRTEELRAVWGRAEDDVYAVGTQGMVLHYYIPQEERNNPEAMPRWFEERPPTTQALNAVHGGRDTVYAVGNNGTIVRRDAMGVWTQMPASTVESLHGIWVNNDGTQGTAVGNLGAIVNLSTAAWSRERIAGLTSPLREVWGRNNGNLHILGLEGTLLIGSAGAWDPVEDLPAVYLRAVHGLQNRDVWMVSWNGAIIHLEGNRHEVYYDFAKDRLEGIWVTREDDPFTEPDDAGVYQKRIAIWVVGVSGTVLKGPFGSNDDGRLPQAR